MKKLSVILLLAISLGSCSTYQKALKSEDVEFQQTVGNEMYEAGKYRKAIKLYDLVAKKESWKPAYQTMYFNLGKSYYNLKQYEVVTPLFKKFNASYVNSPFAEEANYLEAMSLYNRSEVYSLDQHITYEAILKLDDYISRFPDTDFITDAKKYRTELVQKLEKKSYEAAKQYNTIGEYTRDYSAAIVALDNFMLDYPGSIYKEDALFYKYDSAYKLAINSVYSKMEVRLQSAIKAYEGLMNYNGDTKYKKEADQMLARLQKESKQFSNI